MNVPLELIFLTWCEQTIVPFWPILSRCFSYSMGNIGYRSAKMFMSTGQSMSFYPILNFIYPTRATITQISGPNGLVRRDFSVVPVSVFLFSENSQIFLRSVLKFFSNFSLIFSFFVLFFSLGRKSLHFK